MIHRAICFVWGHAVDNHVFERREHACTRCHARCFGSPGAVRVGHTLSCFFRHHTYQRVAERHGHVEYACVQCGHPLLLRAESKPPHQRFAKRVRYLCGLLGHRVHAVTERHGGTEYACDCGHAFVRLPSGRDVVRHPLACVLSGHQLVGLETRAGFSEYACERCGHAFLFAGNGGGSSAGVAA